MHDSLVKAWALWGDYLDTLFVRERCETAVKQLAQVHIVKAVPNMTYRKMQFTIAILQVRSILKWKSISVKPSVWSGSVDILRLII